MFFIDLVLYLKYEREIKEIHMKIYELHIKGLTKLNNNIPAYKRGKFLGLCDDWMINHLKSLNVDAVQIMPIFKDIDTYWGYSPVSWTEHNEKYGTLSELKEMISVLHDNGIKVILDVVFNHTAITIKDVKYCDYDMTGCGNMVDVKLSLDTIMKSIHYWMRDIDVDGMRFDLADVLGMEDGKFNTNAKFFKEMEKYNDKILIAEPWSISSYSVDKYPDNWLQLNDKIRDAVRCGKTYYCGKNYKKYIGFATSHDGFTLSDLVSYNKKHNEKNGENNRDGSDNNYSSNHGAEGITDNQWIIDAREQTKRNMIKNLIISSYHIMILAGDEFGQTQNGCNNDYLYGTSLDWNKYDENSDLFKWYCSALK